MNLYQQTQALKAQANAGVSVARSGILLETAKAYILALTSWLVTGTGAGLGAAAGTPSGAFGLTVGTFGTNSPKIVGEAASGTSKTNKMRRTFALPVEYKAGGNVTVRVKCQEAVAAAQVATTVDLSVYKCDKAAGIGSDICATAAQDVTVSAANCDFSITPTGLVAGDVLDIEINIVTNDTGGSHGTIATIYDTEILLDVQGLIGWPGAALLPPQRRTGMGRFLHRAELVSSSTLRHFARLQAKNGIRISIRRPDRVFNALAVPAKSVVKMAGTDGSLLIVDVCDWLIAVCDYPDPQKGDQISLCDDSTQVYFVAHPDQTSPVCSNFNQLDRPPLVWRVHSVPQ